MKASQAGYGNIDDKHLYSIAQTDVLNKKPWVFNARGQSRQVADVIMDIIRPDYIPREKEMHQGRPPSSVDRSLPIYF